MKLGEIINLHENRKQRPLLSWCLRLRMMTPLPHPVLPLLVDPSLMVLVVVIALKMVAIGVEMTKGEVGVVMKKGVVCVDHLPRM